MQPVEPIIPGQALPVTQIAKDQPQYQRLPSFVDGNGVVLSRWRMTWRERLVTLFRGDVYLQVMTFGNKLQPVLLSVKPPEIE